MVTREEAQKHCEEVGIKVDLSPSERIALSDDDFNMWSWAYSPGNILEVPNQQWAQAAHARGAETIARRESVKKLKTAAGL